MSRRAAREAALQALYQIDISGAGAGEAVNFVVEENNLNEKQTEFLKVLVGTTLDHVERINEIINEISIDWNINRMVAVDRNILRIALCEICYSRDVPPNVAVNEAIELGKTFGTAESGRFINGILGKVLDNLDKYRLDTDITV